MARPFRGGALTIGNFDGVHVGHQAIVRRACDHAQAHDVASVALTFEPHPVRFFRPESPAFRLTTPSQKRLLLSHYGIKSPTVIKFDRSLARLEPEAFIDSVVIDAFQPKLVVVGYDFNFGRDRRGAPALLAERCRSASVPVEIQAPVEASAGVVSSTRIRKAIRAGDVDQVRSLLARPYALIGRVAAGAGRGKGLGIPTANLDPDSSLLPANGVYATRLEVSGDAGGPTVYEAITNIGVRPTFGEERVVVETLVLDESAPADLQLYGARVGVHLLTRLREERAFPSPADLLTQIDVDVARCKALHAMDACDDLVPQAVAALTSEA